MDVRVREVGVAVAVAGAVAAVTVALGFGWTKVDPLTANVPRASEQAPATTSAADTTAPVEGEPGDTTGMIVGQVTDSEGNPVAGVKIWESSSFLVRLQQNWEMPHDALPDMFKPSLAGTPDVTDADGHYRVEVSTTYPGGHFLAFDPPHATQAWTFSGGAAHLYEAKGIEVPVDGETTHDLVMPTVGSIQGRVIGPGLKVRRAQSPWTLEAVRLDGEEPRLIRQVPLTSRRWMVDRLPPGTYRVAVTSEATGDIYHADRLRTRGATKIKVDEGVEVRGIDIALRSPARVGGRVVDRAGRPMVGVAVVLVGGWINGKGGSAADVAGSATTDGSGRWSTSLPTGDYSVHLHQVPPFDRSVEAGRVSATAGRAVVHDVTTDRRASLSGRVSTPAGLEGAVVGFERRVEGEGWMPTGWIDPDVEDGSFSTSGLRAGTYRLVAQEPEGPPVRLVATGAHSPHRFVLRDGLVLTDFDLRIERRKK